METKVMVDTVWVLITAFLVFFMNLGFGAVESGFSRAKNCVNIMSKNFIVFAVSSLGFLIIGWGLMFGDGSSFIGCAVVGKILLSTGLLRHSSDYRIRCGSRANKIYSVHRFHLCDGYADIPCCWALDMGRGMAR
jgi:ammonia channel protein AmtB